MNKRAISDLARSGIKPEEAEDAGLFSVRSARDIYPDFKDEPALVLPYMDPWTGEPMTFERDGEALPFARVRYLAESTPRRGFAKAKPQRYAQPKASGTKPFLPIVPDFDWVEVAEDPDTAIVITEGEKKALAGCLAGFPVVGLGGVSNFMAGGVFLPELDRIEWKDRDVYICFDSDAAEKPQIQAAEGRLAAELSLKRGANVFLSRLPGTASGDKVGLDDYLLKNGADMFEARLLGAQQMRKVDSMVLQMNEDVAWIEAEGLVYDLATGGFIKKDNFVNGSKYSALEAYVPTAKGDKLKRISIASEWLKHPHAQRYDEILFRPGIDSVTVPSRNGGVALNLWTGWDGEEGDVSPFLELTEFLLSETERDVRDLPLKLLAYKVQNPGVKVPLAPVLIGKQGCGKTLWSEIVQEMVSPYGVAVASSQLRSDFNGWIERSLIGVINEAEGEDVLKGADVLKSMISDEDRPMNEKYRPSRQVKTYTLYILTSNRRQVGAYSADDRRMIVINCPEKREEAFYDRISEWKNRQNGPKKLLHYLQNYDLKGWRPPKHAPLTAEKYMAYMESLSPVERLAEEMKTADHNVVQLWIDAALAWAQTAELSNNSATAQQAQEVATSLGRIQIRPWYTPEELAMMFPSVATQLHGTRQLRSTTAGTISRQLRDAGITYLRCKDDPRGFRWRGMVRQFLVVADPEEWGAPITQNEFERMMKHFPTYDGRGA